MGLGTTNDANLTGSHPYLADSSSSVISLLQMLHSLSRRSIYHAEMLMINCMMLTDVTLIDYLID
jgi:hypothetical protein